MLVERLDFRSRGFQRGALLARLGLSGGDAIRRIWAFAAKEEGEGGLPGAAPRSR